MEPMLITVADTGFGIGSVNVSSKIIGTRTDYLSDLKKHPKNDQAAR
jgi:hypothetical protein